MFLGDDKCMNGIPELFLESVSHSEITPMDVQRFGETFVVGDQYRKLWSFFSEFSIIFDKHNSSRRGNQARIASSVPVTARI